MSGRATLPAAELLYPHFDFFVQQLDCPNGILRSNAICTLACLAPADRGNKLEAALDKYLSPIPGPQMIAAGRAIRWASATPFMRRRNAVTSPSVTPSSRSSGSSI
jgi:hypothetical protein